MDHLLLHDARMIIREFVRLRGGETLVVVTDHRRRDEAEALTGQTLTADGGKVMR